MVYGILFFGITIALFSNLPIKIGSVFSIRFLYFPSFGFCFVLPFLLDRIFGARKMLYVILTICCFFSIKTISRNSDWKENYSLFLSDNKYLKNNAKAHLFLGIEYLKKGQKITTDNSKKTALIKKGIHELTCCYRMYPNSIENLENLGNAYQMLHQNDSAIYYFTKVQKIDNTSCNGNLGDIYFDIKDFKNAIRFYKKEIHFHPKSVRGYHNLGMTLASIGAYHRALIYLKKGILVAPKNIEIKLLLAQVYKAMGDEVNFLKYYRLANNILQ
jgi:tetratricopeptide (TPR) repeat protein